MNVIKSFRCFRPTLLLFCYIELLCVARKATGEIVVPPTDEEAVVSHNVTLTCRSNIQSQFPIRWYYLLVGTGKYKEILYETGYFYNGPNGQNRYEIIGNTSDGEFNLVISNVRLEDAGRYTCKDTAGSEATAELIIYESYPNVLNCFTNQPPDGVVDANDCGLRPDTLHMSCNISYRSHLEPVLEWKQGSETLSATQLKPSDTSIVSSIQMTADEIRSPNFECRIRYLKSNIESKFKWLTTVQELANETKQYDVSCRESTVQSIDCAFNTSHQCSYRWTNSNGDESFSGSILKFTSSQKAASFICHADCLVRDTQCSFTPAKVTYTCDKGESIAPIIVAVLVGCAVIAVSFVTVVLIARRRRLQ